MKHRLKPIREQVIVITGASSGIGLATARCAAKKGAKLVLAARSEDALRDISRQINQAGGQATHIAADVSRKEDVERIAQLAIQSYGGFDTWVNDAGLSIYGKLEDVGDTDARRLFDVNYWGTVYGSLAAVKHLKERGGALINVGSEVSDVAVPMQGMYVASKHAVKGFTDALRIELESEKAPVSVTLIKPSAIDTPFPQHARNLTDKEPKLPSPAYPAEEVALSILHCAEHPERDMFVGGMARMQSAMGRMVPKLADKMARKHVTDQFKDEAPKNPEGTLYYGGNDGRIEGGHPGWAPRMSLYSRAARHPLVTGAVIAAFGLSLAAVGRSRLDL